MTRSALWLVAAALLACEGREVSVFEMPATTGGSAQAGSSMNDTPSAGVGGTSAGAGGSTGGAASVQSDTGGGGAGGGAPYLPEGGNGGAPVVTTMPKPCVGEQDCQPGWVCDKPGCDASTSGVCVPWPAFCDPDPRPVCGCDGVTYWNDCIRLQSHAQLEGPEPCRATACTCEVGADCAVPYASCSHLLPPGEMCGPGMGACWVLPSVCEANADRKRWRECKPPPGELPQCVDTCTAIASEHSFAELHRGEVCN